MANDPVSLVWSYALDQCRHPHHYTFFNSKVNLRGSPLHFKGTKGIKA
ncbi:hypothetical protein CCACVL1_22972, partial [Corchorus capsularis]